MIQYIKPCMEKFFNDLQLAHGFLLLLWFPPPINDLLIDLLCLTSLSAISWRPVLVVEEAGVSGERTTNHGQATGKLYHLRLRVKCTIFVIYKAGHAPTPYW